MKLSRKNLKLGATVVAFVCLYLLAESMTYSDEMDAQAMYCADVAYGVPAYKDYVECD